MKFTLKVMAILFALLAGIIVILLFVLNYYFFNINKLPVGELITESVSPTGDYTVKTYMSYGSATVADAVRGEVIYHKKKDKTKNIYWQYREDEAEIVWVDDYTVSINGMALDVRTDVYDFRKE